jgi:hypothetical protein
VLQVPCSFAAFGCTATMERRTSVEHQTNCPYASYAAGLSAAMDDLQVLRRLTAAGLSEAIAAAGSRHDGSATHRSTMKTGDMPYPAAVIAEARARLGAEYEWAELSEAQRLEACRRCVESSHLSELSLAELTSSGVLHAAREDPNNLSNASAPFSPDINDTSLSSAVGVRFEDHPHPTRDLEAGNSSLLRHLEDPLQFSASLISPSKGGLGDATARGTTAENSKMTFVLTATLPAPRRPGFGNKPSLTPVAEARGQLAAVAPFLASVGADEGSLCLWCGLSVCSMPCALPPSFQT